MAMSSPFLAEITMFGFNFAPKGWAFCQGQLLPISQNTALFSLLGTTYGGDGKSTFALPNLQDQTAVSFGQGPGLEEYFLGEPIGVPAVTLLTTEMPSHSHSFSANTSPGTTVTAAGNQLGVGQGGTKQNSYNANVFSTAIANATTGLSPNAISIAGSSLPHNNMQPYLTLNFCIAMQGVFPPRS
jgi:microcystin-dependent protein